MPKHKKIDDVLKNGITFNTLSDKTIARIIRIFFYIAFLGTLFWTLQRMSLISQIGTEDVYWERARFLLGYSDASLYDGSSICSLGYSLILAPICALAGSSQAAYKAALILNMLFLGFSYRVAVGASKRLFPKEKESFLSIVCFLAVMCPAFAYARTTLAPDMAVMLLTWCSIWLLTSLWESGRKSTLALLALCLILIAFLQITALGVILAVTVVLLFYVKNERISESSFLAFVPVVFLGILAGNIAERVFLYAFASDMDLPAIRTSLEVMLGAIGSVPTVGYFRSLLFTLIGKLYSVLIASFLLICPVMWSFFRMISGKHEFFRNRIKTYTEESDEDIWQMPSCSIVAIFLIQFIWLCLYGVSQEMEEGIFSLSGIYMVISPMILMGIVLFKDRKDWKRDVVGYLLLLGICAFMVIFALEDADDTFVRNAFGGFLMIFRNAVGSTLNVSVSVPAAAFLIGFFGSLFFILKRISTGREKLDLSLHGCSFVMLLGVFAIMNIMTVNWSVRRDSLTYFDKFDTVTDLISESGSVTDCVYLTDGENEDLLPILQFLLPDMNVSMVEGDATEINELYSLDSNADKVIMLTDVDTNDNTGIYENYEEKLDGWYVQFFAKYYAIWTKSGSEVESALEQVTETRVRTAGISKLTTEEYEIAEAEEADADVMNDEEASDTEADDAGTDDVEKETEEKSASTGSGVWGILNYGGTDLNLEAGTWRAEIPLHTNSKDNLSGTATVLVNDTEICTISFDESILDSNGDGVVSVEFASRAMLLNVSVRLEGTLIGVSSAGELSCQKLTSGEQVEEEDSEEISSYAEGEDISDLLQIVTYLEKGTTLYVVQEYSVIRNKNVTYMNLQEQLSEYPISEISYYTAQEMTGDAILLTYGMSINCLELLEEYSILGHAGQYTLWAKTDGEYLAVLSGYGIGSLNDGTKLSCASVEAMTGLEAEENEILGLPKARYRIYLQLSVKDLDSQATVRVTLWRNKTESELETELASLMRSGYTEEEALKEIVDPVSVQENNFSLNETTHDETLLVTMTLDAPIQLDRLSCKATTPPGDKVEAKILWVELIDELDDDLP